MFPSDRGSVGGRAGTGTAGRDCCHIVPDGGIISHPRKLGWAGIAVGMPMTVGGDVSRTRKDDRIHRVVDRTRALARRGFDTATFAARLVSQLAVEIPHSAACVLTTDPASGLLTGTHKFGGLVDHAGLDGPWAELEYGADDPTALDRLSHQAVPAMATSLLPGGADDSIRIRELLRPAGYGDEIRLVARHGGVTWGGVNLFRAVGERPFDPDDVALLARISDPIASGLRAGLMVAAVRRGDAGATTLPAVIVVGPGGLVEQISRGADEVLDEICGGDTSNTTRGIVEGLVAATRRHSIGLTPTPPRVRLRCPTGRWLVAQTTPLASQNGTGDSVAIVIDEARPPEIVTVLALAFDLTARERDVTGLVLGGLGTKAIAQRLEVSAYTVQDHLKSVFAKADVRSRRELMARVFFDQYAPRLTGEIGPTGWFTP